jgi:hypothetical protein
MAWGEIVALIGLGIGVFAVFVVGFHLLLSR